MTHAWARRRSLPGANPGSNPGTACSQRLCWGEDKVAFAIAVGQRGTERFSSTPSNLFGGKEEEEKLILETYPVGDREGLRQLFLTP